jgi:signal transduction histidine kinase
MSAMRSVRLRLLAGAACAIAAALVISWVALVLLFDQHIRRNVEDDLIRHGQQIAAALPADGASLVLPPEAGGDSRFSLPMSGLYWQISDADRIVRSRSLWDAAMDVPQPAPADVWARDLAEGPFGSQVIRVYRSVRASEAASPVTLVVGLDRSGIIGARNEFAGELALFLALLWAALSAAAWLQVRIGLSPLRSVETSVAGLKASPASRLDPLQFPAEVTPLVDQINTLAETREKDLQAARERAANLAHALKTPLAALSALARKARTAGERDLADGFEASIRAASETVERELARARTAASRERGPCEAAPVLARLADVLRRTDRGGRIGIALEAPPGMMLPVHADQLFEMAGPLMDNAVRYARAQVRVSAAARELTVEDDGPGLGSEDREQVVLRGQRADQRPGGHGLGLSIAHDLAEATGGQLVLETSDLGGLKARILW